MPETNDATEDPAVAVVNEPAPERAIAVVYCKIEKILKIIAILGGASLTILVGLKAILHDGDSSTQISIIHFS